MSAGEGAFLRLLLYGRDEDIQNWNVVNGYPGHMYDPEHPLTVSTDKGCNVKRSRAELVTTALRARWWSGELKKLRAANKERTVVRK